MKQITMISMFFILYLPFFFIFVVKLMNINVSNFYVLKG